MKVALRIHLAALVVAAVAAWFVFQPGGQSTDSGEIILDTTADQVRSLEYRSDNRELVAEAFDDQGGGFLLTVRERLSKRVPHKREPAKQQRADEQRASKEKDDGRRTLSSDEEAAAEGGPPDRGPAGADAAAEKKSDEKADSSPKEEEAAEFKLTRYRASEEFSKALERLFPLVAVRQLDQVPADKLEKFGLTEPKGRLTIQSRGQTVRFQVGGQTYGGSSTYVRRGAHGPVSLVAASLLRAVDVRPPRYMERRLHKLALNDVERIRIDCLARGDRTLQQRNPGQVGGKATWVAADAPDSQDDLYGNWVGKLFRLSVTEYLSEPVDPVAGSHCKLALFERDGQPQAVELTWKEAQAGKQEVFGHSGLSRSWVKLEPSNAAALVSDIPSILGGEPPAAKPE